MKRGDVVVLRADKIYERYGKDVPYYLVVERYDRDIVKVHDPVSKEMTAVPINDLILISSNCGHQKNF
mgnify:CR=1 FL=1